MTRVDANCPSCGPVTMPASHPVLTVDGTVHRLGWLCACTAWVTERIFHGPRVYKLLGSGVVAVSADPATVEHQVLEFRRRLDDDRWVRAAVVAATKELGR